MASRVLLIDDDARLPELLASYLGQNGVSLTAAPDGATRAGWWGFSRFSPFAVESAKLTA